MEAAPVIALQQVLIKSVGHYWNDLIVYCLAHPDAKVTPKYGEDGGVVGLYVDMQANISGSGSLNASTSNGNNA